MSFLSQGLLLRQLHNMPQMRSTQSQKRVVAQGAQYGARSLSVASLKQKRPRPHHRVPSRPVTYLSFLKGSSSDGQKRARWECHAQAGEGCCPSHLWTEVKILLEFPTPRLSLRESGPGCNWQRWGRGCQMTLWKMGVSPPSPRSVTG